MEVAVSINGKLLHHVRVVNRGPKDGVYEPGDDKGGDGLRVYDWECGRFAGQVVHRRADGAVVLAGVVLAELDVQIETAGVTALDRDRPRPPGGD